MLITQWTMGLMFLYAKYPQNQESEQWRNSIEYTGWTKGKMSCAERIQHKMHETLAENLWTGLVISIPGNSLFKIENNPVYHKLDQELLISWVSTFLRKSGVLLQNSKKVNRRERFHNERRMNTITNKL